MTRDTWPRLTRLRDRAVGWLMSGERRALLYLCLRLSLERHELKQEVRRLRRELRER